ncbi:MAG: AAA family ATPase [Candidatus Thorarchaeota archaeon]
MKFPITDDREIDKIASFENVCRGKVLIMTYGLPCSGKSTWAQSQTWPIVDPDGIRLAKTGQRWWGPIEHEVWATARTMVRALFWAGHPFVILDSTCYSRRQRDMFLPSADIPWLRFYKPFDTSLEVCCKRAEESYPALVDMIHWINDQWEPIQSEENITLWP